MLVDCFVTQHELKAILSGPIKKLAFDQRYFFTGVNAQVLKEALLSGYTQLEFLDLGMGYFDNSTKDSMKALVTGLNVNSTVQELWYGYLHIKPEQCQPQDRARMIAKELEELL